MKIGAVRTFREVATQMDISEARVRAIEKNAFRKIRRAFLKIIAKEKFVQ